MQNNTAPHHNHQFDQGNPLAQKKILLATILTAVMMVFEIMGGWVFQSMALLADGWHMSSHVLALGLAFAAYKAARHYADDPRFNMGTWRIEILAGYSSAIMLLVIAGFMAFHSIERLFAPVEIHYNEAIPIAILGLFINLVCAWLLHNGGHEHAHGHHHDHEHHHGHSDHQHDLNHQAAFMHVVADALTSVFAIIALLAGKYFGWDILDAVLGIVGSVLVARWSIGLLKQTAKTLLDADMDAPVVDEIREVIAEFGPLVKLSDLHVSRVGKGKFACFVALETALDLSPDQVRDAISIHEEIVHISVEINPLTSIS
ncbi:CDF family Co(II)/Ni(II) efflux transporter DmeF [Acinetobacter schindleri]|uniref:CDF family Co(II)/Ni(II) efflux transporter DmeF n=1 Tax=Acinetobacter schindleri TaxID=108981 RepID=UPI0028128810|nr:CDF family Co(II)/Ni(II) efflux transporter DmeF [Acinetobacter schindleri]